MTATAPAQVWLTPADVAAEMGVCRATVLRAIARGEMPGRRFGTVVRISPEEFARYRAGTWQLHPEEGRTATAPRPDELIRRRSA
jgi:excisionase family DNA binding protein